MDNENNKKNKWGENNKAIWIIMGLIMGLLIGTITDDGNTSKYICYGIIIGSIITLIIYKGKNKLKKKD